MSDVLRARAPLLRRAFAFGFSPPHVVRCAVEIRPGRLLSKSIELRRCINVPSRAPALFHFLLLETADMLSDIEIAQAARLTPIDELAHAAGLADAEFEPYGRDKAKVDLDPARKERGRVV